MTRASGLFGKMHLAKLNPSIIAYYSVRVVTVLMGISSLVFYTLAARAPLVNIKPAPQPPLKLSLSLISYI